MTLEVGNLLSLSDVGHAQSQVQELNSEKTKPSGHSLHLHLTGQRNSSSQVDTSSQASAQEEAEMAEASLEGVPTTISPIAATTRSESITPPTDDS